MKRVLSMLLAIAMILSMVPSVFASEEVPVLTDISEFEVTLNEENGYFATYTWTPSEDGELSLYQYTEKEIEMALYQGDNSASSFYDFGDGDLYYSFAVSMPVVAGEEVTIEFLNANEEEEVFYAYGEFMGAPGKDANNPIILEDVYATVTNTETLWYSGFFSGAEVSVTGTGDFSVILDGETMTAVDGKVTFTGSGNVVIFAIVGEGDFTIQAVYPLGSQMNPEALFRPAYILVNLAEGNDQGYYYKWTAMEGGQLKLTCPTIEGVAYDVSLYNLNTWENNTLQESEDGTVAVNVSAGDEVQIRVSALPDENGARPAVNTGLTGELLQNIGTHENPEVILGAEEIQINIAEGNNQGYYYKWTTFADGELTLTCPTVEGVEYDVILTNMTTFAQAWLSDSTDGTVSIAVSNGDAVVIEIGVYPDADWNYPGLETTLAGSFTYPVGSYENPEIVFRPNYIQVSIPESVGERYYKWTANADGELVLTYPEVEGVEYQVILTNLNTYDSVWPNEGTGTIAVSAGDEVLIDVIVSPDDNWNTPALDVALTGKFAYPVGTQMNPEVIFRPNYIGVNIAEGNNQGYYYKWTANADGTLKLTCPAVEGVAYDVNMTNMSTYAQAWLVDSTDGTISLDVKQGDEVIIQVAALPDANWNIPALSTALTGEFIFPVGSQMNPEILFRPNYIGVNIAEGNNQGYYYKWTANADGTLKLTCPAVEGVAYDVNMTNMSTYAQAWLVDSTDGTISLDVKQGDEVIIQVAAIPDASWNIPALTTALTGEFIFPVGSQMNPEVIEELSWYYGNVSQAEDDIDGYYYTYTAPIDGDCVFYFGFNEGLEDYILDIIVTNMNTYAQKSLLNDGVDNYGMELQIAVKEGDVLQIQIVAIQDAEGNYAPAAEMTWCGNLTYPVGSEKNPLNLDWVWNDEYTDAACTVVVPAGKTYYISATAGMILTVDGVETAMDEAGVFSITNSSETDVTYALALATPVGAYANPEEIENLPLEDTNSLKADESYYYIWTATEDTQLVLDVTDGANITVDVLTYTEDSEWPISEQYALAEPEIDENWNYIGWIVQDNLVLDVKAGQQLKIQVNGLTDWTNWSTPAIDYTLTITAEKVIANGITKQPEDQCVGYLETAQFTVEANGAVSYRWQYRRDADSNWSGTKLDGYKSATLNVAMTTKRTGYQYRCAVTLEDGTVVYSEPATLTMDAKVEITAAPSDATGLEGSFALFTVEATDALAYKWYYRRNVDDTWHPTSMKGYTTETLHVLVTPNRNGYQYRCRITCLDGSITYTDPATLTVEKCILKQPVNKAAQIGEIAEFTVEAQNVKAYQWVYRANAESGWKITELEGCQTATLKVPMTAKRAGYQYKCRITNNDGSELYTNEATLLAAAQITQQPEDVEVVWGDRAEFTVVAENAAFYQWQYSKDGGNNWYATQADGNTTATLSVEAKQGNNGYQYRCRITNSEGSLGYSETATLTTVPFANVRIRQVQDIEGRTFIQFVMKTNISPEDIDETVKSQTWQKLDSETGEWVTVVYYEGEVTSLGEVTSGQYRCIVEGVEGTVKYSNTLEVTI